MALSTETAARSQTINLRIAPKQRELIDQAAKAIGKTRSEFILDTVTKEAENTLLDQRVFLLDSTQWQQFLDALDAPAQPREALRKLLTTKAPWES